MVLNQLLANFGLIVISALGVLSFPSVVQDQAQGFSGVPYVTLGET
jgi:hypothetical protein